MSDRFARITKCHTVCTSQTPSAAPHSNAANEIAMSRMEVCESEPIYAGSHVGSVAIITMRLSTCTIGRNCMISRAAAASFLNACCTTYDQPSSHLF
eukprot:4822032-Prymnesium_polylepis.6